MAPLSQVVLYFQDWSFWSFLAQAVALTEVSKAKDNLCVLFVLVLFGECYARKRERCSLMFFCFDSRRYTREDFKWDKKSHIKYPRLVKANFTPNEFISPN